MLENPIEEIHIAHGSTIDSIMFCTIDKDGRCVSSPKFGGGGGYKKVKVTIEKAPLEYLTGIRGTLGHSPGKHVVVKSLLFTTNLKSYGPFGIENGGTPFSLVMKAGGGAIVGFHGRSGLYLDAIGVYLQQATHVPVHANNIVLKQPKVEAVDGFHDKMDGMKAILPRSPGPWGGCSGKPWDDGVYNSIKRVQVHFDRSSSTICALQFEYEKKDRTAFWSEVHGNGCDALVCTIKLEMGSAGTENEFLIGIEGFYSPVDAAGGIETIRQITFYTNKGKHGPYGYDIGVYFSSTAARGKIVGFHGRSGAYLNAIGVHMEYF